ncbi:MAG: hypothetical protein ACFFCX_16330 [Candidatus Sifarchaeia archaeon]
MAYTYSTVSQNALLAIIRICQRSKGWRDELRATTDLSKVRYKNNKFWKELDKTDNDEALWLIVKMLKNLTIPEDQWCALRGDALEDYVYNFALNNSTTIVAGKTLTDDLLDLLALGLGPWPKGNGTE